MKKLDGRLYMKNFGQIYILFTGNIDWKSNWICDMSTRDFLIEILLHIYIMYIIYFYYSQIMRTFSQSFYYFLIHIQSFF